MMSLHLIFSHIESVVDPVLDHAVDKILVKLLGEKLEGRSVSGESARLVALVILPLFTRNEVTVDLQLVHIVLLVLVLAILVLQELCGQITVSEDALGQVLKVRGSQVFHTVGLLVIVEHLPVWLSSLVSLLNINVVSVHVDGEHCLRINIYNHERRVHEIVSGHRATN